jgi:uncharacterized protein YjbJ (UPF0337 family)
VTQTTQNCATTATVMATTAHPHQAFTRKAPIDMSIGKKIAHKAEAAKGTGKKLFGRATGNTRLRGEGRVDQAKGDTKQAGAKMKEAFKH